MLILKIAIAVGIAMVVERANKNQIQSLIGSIVYKAFRKIIFKIKNLLLKSTFNLMEKLNLWEKP